MNIKNIFLMSFLGVMMLVGGVKELWAGDLLSSLGLDPKSVNYFIWNDYDLNGAVGDACNTYCNQNKDACDCGPGGCDGNPDQYSNRPLPKTAAGFACVNDFIQNAIKNPRTYKLPNVCARSCTRQACLHDDVQILEVCMYLCCEISQGGTDYLADCYSGLPHYGNGLCGNYLQGKKFIGGKAQTKAMMTPHPLVIRQDNKALRGNAPQTIRERGTNQKWQSRNNLQTGQPRVMPPLNQGKLPQRKTQHPGMMHIEPHHPAMLPPVNQGRTAPSVNAQHNHSGMKPVENRGRTTPPKMKPDPSLSHDAPSTPHPTMIHVNPQHPGMVPLDPHPIQAPKKLEELGKLR